MSSLDHNQVVADEAALERQYGASLAQRATNLQIARNRTTANTWTTNTEVETPRAGQIVGRVALKKPSEEFLDGRQDFYIGTAHHDAGDYEVFSWTAPVACAFYRKSSEHHPLCEEVSGVRVFAHVGGKIADFQDQTFTGLPTESMFPRRQLVIPKAPGAPSNETLSPSEFVRPKEPEVEQKTSPAEVVESGGPAPVLSTPIQQAPTATNRSLPTEPELRAGDLLRRQLAKPKTVSMAAVLSTLQSDQYEAITRPVIESQVLQGHPGTGKTVIAAHRAAYLLNEESPETARPRGRVLILGPTTEYVKHIQGALRELMPDTTNYEVQSLPSLLDKLAGLPESTLPTESMRLENVSQELARLVDIALQRTKNNVQGDIPSADDVYAELVWLRDDPPSEGLDRAWWEYLGQLPGTLQELKNKKTRAYLGLLAYLGVRTTHTPDPGHVIVDEAQDIHPIEWEILGRLGNVGGWTILGDLNQRRTDHTFGSWNDVARILAIEDENGEAPTRILENGYRSTAQIIKFANQLLPARDRKLFSLQQDGELPHIQRVASIKHLYPASITAAKQLIGRVGRGTVAIISPNIEEIRSTLRKEGWQAETGNPFVWQYEALGTLRLLPPERARGLEFDAVVVVEPVDFPENFGRQGVLYTALTRANRFLTVIHHRALPSGMKARP